MHGAREEAAVSVEPGRIERGAELTVGGALVDDDDGAAETLAFGAGARVSGPS
jgi:hypothetical protein